MYGPGRHPKFNVVLSNFISENTGCLEECIALLLRLLLLLITNSKMLKLLDRDLRDIRRHRPRNIRDFRNWLGGMLPLILLICFERFVVANGICMFVR